jgi:prepilin-type N-terminal cleavage/methylation domain-containing protein
MSARVVPAVRIVRERRGVTLVELIVALSIGLIVLGLTSTFIVFGTNFLTKTEISSEDKIVAEDAADYAKYRLLYSTSIQVIRAEEPPWIGGGHSGGDILYIGNEDGTRIANSGKLFYMRGDDTQPIDVLGNARYEGSTLAWSYRAIVASATDPTRLSSSGVADATSPLKSFELIVSTIRNGQAVYDSKKTFSLYEVAANSEPNISASISSWSNQSDFDATMAKFYLLISPSSPGYVQNNLLTRFDAIDNSMGGPTVDGAHHDPNNRTAWYDLTGKGNDMKLIFTDNAAPIRDQSVYFDGVGDYGVIENFDLSAYSEITVEVCFRIADANLGGMLFEYGLNWNRHRGAFGVAMNDYGLGYSSGMGHTNMGYPDTRAVNYKWANTTTTTFTTHTNYFSLQAGPPRAVWVNGAPETLYSFNSLPVSVYTPPVYASSRTFVTDVPGEQKFFLGCRGRGDGDSSVVPNPIFFYKGEIASVRIYAGKLTPDQIAQNAAADQARFGF